MKRLDMHIPHIGKVDKINTYSSSTYVLGHFINVHLYWKKNNSRSQLELVSKYMNDIENIIQHKVLNVIVTKAHCDHHFMAELNDIAAKNHEYIVMSNSNVQLEIFNRLKVKDIYIDPTEGCIAFHVYFTSNNNDMIEVVSDFSLSCKSCDTKYRELYLSVNIFSSFEYFELRYEFDNNEYLKLVKAIEWAECIDGKKSERLRSYLEMINKYRGAHQRGIIGENAWHVAKSISELKGVHSVYSCFVEQPNHDLREHLKYITKGVAFKYQGLKVNNDKCRDFLFELKVASEYLKNGYDICVNERSDIVVNNEFYIECKKVSSHKKFIKRLSEAIKQVNFEKSEGVIYIDATDLIDLSCAPLVINDRWIDFPDKNGVSPTDDRVQEDFINAAQEICQKFFDEVKDNIFSKLGNHLVVVHFDFSCLHFSPIHERAAHLVLRYMISNGANSKVRYLVESSM